MHEIAGSIVVYQNPKDEVLKAATSFLGAKLDVQLYVIDNSPDDRLRKCFSDRRVTYIFNGRNLGFGAAHNIAMKRSLGRAKYHLALNPDVRFDAGVLERLFSFASSRPEIGLLMPKVLNPDGSTQHLCKRLPAPSDLFIRRFLPKAFGALAEQRLAQYELRDNDYNSILSVPALSGCFMLMKSAALAEVGLFDERFFLYLEDVDLCRRIRQRFETVYFPEVAIVHGYQKGSYRSARLLMHHVISAVRYFQKWGWYSDAERIKINQESTHLLIAE